MHNTLCFPKLHSLSFYMILNNPYPYLSLISDIATLIMSDKSHILESRVNLYVLLKVYFLIGAISQHQESKDKTLYTITKVNPFFFLLLFLQIHVASCRWLRRFQMCQTQNTKICSSFCKKERNSLDSHHI